MADHTSTEVLRHYRCDRCERIRDEQISSGVPANEARTCWWSIADGPNDCPCPWCAQENVTKLYGQLLESCRLLESDQDVLQEELRYQARKNLEVLFGDEDHGDESPEGEIR